MSRSPARRARPHLHHVPERVWADSLRLVKLPRAERGPVRAVAVRMSVALAALLTMVAIVYFDRDGYADADGNGVTLLDAFYYATVSLSTTGYGDIAPRTPDARLINVIVVTPLRILFLLVLVGTTLEVLTQRTRDQFLVSRWRSHLRDHVVVVGYGTKGRSAVRALIAEGVPREQIVVIDPSPEQVAEANADGLAGVEGDGTRTEVLVRAAVAEARSVVVAAHRDDTSILTVLTVRQLNQDCQLVAAARETENVSLLRQSGADIVVLSSGAAGRLLGLATSSPATGTVLEDLLEPQRGLEIGEREVQYDEVGRSPHDCRDLVMAVVRDGRVYRYSEPTVQALQRADRLVVVRSPQDPTVRPLRGLGTREHDEEDA